MKLFCSYYAIIQWLQNNLLTCPFKKFSGYDCPGCGFQRSVIALLQGSLVESLHLYPAAIPLIIFGLISIFNQQKAFDKRFVYLRKGCLVFAMVIGVVSYGYKLAGYLI